MQSGSARPAMDRHEEKQAEENKFQESPAQRRKEEAMAEEEKEAENKQFQESPDEQRKAEAMAEEEKSRGEESMEQREGREEAGKNDDQSEEPAGQHQLKEVVAAAEEECVVSVVDDEGGSPLVGLFAHPCSLLQYLLRICAGCWGLHDGAFSDDDRTKPAAPASPEAAAATVEDASAAQDGGEKANQLGCYRTWALQYVYMSREVVSRVWAVRRPRPPGHPREGSGGNGGHHN